MSYLRFEMSGGTPTRQVTPIATKTSSKTIKPPVLRKRNESA